jgi:hypothetical protein
MTTCRQHLGSRASLRTSLGAFLLLVSALSCNQVVAAESLPPPDRLQAVQLIRSTMSAMNDANLTSNYSVLHSLGSPEFRAAYSPDQLATTFKALRDKKLDLALVARFEPVIEDAILRPTQRLVQFKGYFPTHPAHVRFRLSYQLAEERWKLYGFDLDIEAPSGTALTSSNSL